jgi:hypothetical protein
MKKRDHAGFHRFRNEVIETRSEQLHRAMLKRGKFFSVALNFPNNLRENCETPENGSF